MLRRIVVFDFDDAAFACGLFAGTAADGGILCVCVGMGVFVCVCACVCV